MIRAVITITAGPRKLAEKFSYMMKEALQQAILYWHNEYLPGHFTTQASGKYHYASRSAKYRKQKLNKFGHQNPLVYRGQLKREATGGIRISGTARMATGAIRVPAYVSAWTSATRNAVATAQGRKPRRMPDMAAELVATTNEEARQMGKIVAAVIKRESDRVKDSETIVVSAA